MERLNKVKNAYSILAVVLVILGILLFCMPWMAVEFLYKICGVVMMIFGIVKFVGYFTKDLFQLAFQFDFAMGGISVIIGGMLLFKTMKSVEFTAVVIGIFMLMDALLRIQTTLDAKKIGMERWKDLLLISIIAAVIGILLLLMPGRATKWMIRLIGLNLCIDGVLNLVIVQSTVEKFRRIRDWEM